MKIIFNKGSEYPWCWSNYLGNELMDLSNDEPDNDICLCLGLNTLNQEEDYIKNLFKKYSKVCYLDFAQSSLFFDNNFKKYNKNLSYYTCIFK